MQMSASIAEGILVLGLPSVADTQVDTYKSTAVQVSRQIREMDLMKNLARPRTIYNRLSGVVALESVE